MKDSAGIEKQSFASVIAKSSAALTYRGAFFLLFALLLLMTLSNAAFIPLECGDETRVAGISAEIFAEKEFLMPRLNGNEFLEYPPLYYIVQAGSFAVFGVNDLAAKLPSILCAVSGALMIFGFAKAMKCTPVVSLLTGLMLGGCVQYFGNALAAMVDSMLAMFCILAWWGFYRLAEERKYISGFIMLACGIAGGVLTKNLPGFAIPVSGIGIYLIVSDIFAKEFTWKRWLATGFSILAGLLIYALYAYFLYSKHGYDAFHTLVIWNNAGRFTGTSGQHEEPWYYYLGKLPEQLHPYLIPESVKRSS